MPVQEGLQIVQGGAARQLRVDANPDAGAPVTERHQPGEESRRGRSPQIDLRTVRFFQVDVGHLVLQAQDQAAPELKTESLWQYWAGPFGINDKGCRRRERFATPFADHAHGAVDP